MAVRRESKNKNTEITHEIGYACDYVKILTAREMFEELGYELIQNDMNWVVYTINKGKWFQFDISFFKQDKSVHLNTKETTFGHSFDMNELKAINKQVEELGWNK